MTREHVEAVIAHLLAKYPRALRVFQSEIENAENLAGDRQVAMSDEHIAFLKTRYSASKEVWACVLSEVYGAESNPAQAQAVREFIALSLTCAEALVIFSMRRGDLQKSLICVAAQLDASATGRASAKSHA